MGASSRVDILLVDDRAVDADMTLLALRRAAPHLRVFTLRSGNEALQYLFSVGEFSGRPPGMPRLVMLDAEMPVVSGLCVLDVIRAHPLTSSVPVAILSPHPLPRTVRRSDRFAADAYIVRPLDLALYSALLERSLRRVPSLRLQHDRLFSASRPRSVTRIAEPLEQALSHQLG